MVDIQSPTAEIRRGKEKDGRRNKTKRQKYNVQSGHNDERSTLPVDNKQTRHVNQREQHTDVQCSAVNAPLPASSFETIQQIHKN